MANLAIFYLINLQKNAINILFQNSLATQQKGCATCVAFAFFFALAFFLFFFFLFVSSSFLLYNLLVAKFALTYVCVLVVCLCGCVVALLPLPAAAAAAVWGSFHTDFIDFRCELSGQTR